jgi:HPt (histidine-containing phosphotransfer) domain-containing protein
MVGMFGGAKALGGSVAEAAAQTDRPPDETRPEAALDLEHLRRMTLGEPMLEREVLALFDQQAGLLLSRMQDAAPAVVAACAHTLKGSARGIGAWRVAGAASLVETNAAAPDTVAASEALARLSAAVDETKALIAEMLKPHRSRHPNP